MPTEYFIFRGTSDPRIEKTDSLAIGGKAATDIITSDPGLLPDAVVRNHTHLVCSL